MVRKIITVMIMVTLLTGCGNTRAAKQKKSETMETKYIEEVVQKKPPTDAEVVWKDGKLEKGVGRWNAFLRHAEFGISDKIVIKQIFSAISSAEENEVQDKEPYESSSTTGTETFISRLEYDGKEFHLTQFDSPEESLANSTGILGENSISIRKYTYKYLIERKNETGRFGKTDINERGYFLVNDDQLTFDDIMWSMFSSNSKDFVEYHLLFFVYH